MFASPVWAKFVVPQVAPPSALKTSATLVDAPMGQLSHVISMASVAPTAPLAGVWPTLPTQRTSDSPPDSATVKE